MLGDAGHAWRPPPGFFALPSCACISFFRRGHNFASCMYVAKETSLWNLNELAPTASNNIRNALHYTTQSAGVCARTKFEGRASVGDGSIKKFHTKRVDIKAIKLHQKIVLNTLFIFVYASKKHHYSATRLFLIAYGFHLRKNVRGKLLSGAHCVVISSFCVDSPSAGMCIAHFAHSKRLPRVEHVSSAR